MTESQRNAIASPADGLIIYNTTTHCINFRKAGVWADTCKPIITITTQPTAAQNYVCDGNSSRVLTVVAKASNGGALTYQWYHNGNLINGWNGITGEKTPTLILPQTAANISGTYRVRVSLGGISVTSNAFVFNWLPNISNNYVLSRWGVMHQGGGAHCPGQFYFEIRASSSLIWIGNPPTAINSSLWRTPATYQYRVRNGNGCLSPVISQTISG